MESIDVHFNEPGVEDVTPNDIEQGYYCPRLMGHLELRPLDVSTISNPKIETQLVVVALHDVGLFTYEA
jgi:hypothetical protein